MIKVMFILLLPVIAFSLVACNSVPGVNSEHKQASEEKEQIIQNENSQITTAVDFADSDIYTFFNKGANRYLSCEGRTLFLSKTSYNWMLKETDVNKFNICAQNQNLMLDIDNAYIKEGTVVKVWEYTGYDAQVWNIYQNSNGTYSILYSGNNQYCLGFDGEKANLQIRNENKTSQEWEVVKVSDASSKDYQVYISGNSIIELRLPLDILKVIDKSRLQQWANELEKAYYSYRELTNFSPYKKIIVEAYKPTEYIGWVIDNSNIIHIDSTFIFEDLQKMSARECDWNFCALHEMGHMFDCNRPWNFEAELMTDLKLAYVLEKNNVAAAPSEFKATDIFYGKDIINAYRTLGSDFSKNYNIFGCAERFLKIKEDIGWEPFKQTFHYLQANEITYQNYSKKQRFEAFIKLLSDYSGKNIKGYFSVDEWNTILNECK